MNAIKDFFSKWGIMLTCIFSLCSMWNSCGVTSRLEKMDKHLMSMEKTINYNDSLDREISSLQREIQNNEIAYRVVYDNNAIVRTAARPDDVMNIYSTKIKELQERLNKLKDARK